MLLVELLVGGGHVAADGDDGEEVDGRSHTEPRARGQEAAEGCVEVMILNCAVPLSWNFIN